jgi:hypothetical protein
MNIFEANFLERKILISLLSYKKIVEETANIVCLITTLLNRRLEVALKVIEQMNQKENSMLNESMTKHIDNIDRLNPDSSFIGIAATSTGATPGSRRPSINLDQFVIEQP